MRHERELIWIGSGNLTLFGQRSSTERPLSDGAFPSILKRRPICPMAQKFCRLYGKSDHADFAAALGAVASNMTHISGHDRSQMFLLPESVDDYVGVDNPVRFIDAFVDELDLAAAGFVGVEPKATGRPGYAPADLKALHLWLSEPGAVEPEARVGMPSEHRGHLAVSKPEAGLQDHRRLPARQSRCLAEVDLAAAS